MPNEGWKAFTCRNPQPLYAAIEKLPENVDSFNAAPRNVQKMLTAFLNAHNIIRKANDNSSH